MNKKVLWIIIGVLVVALVGVGYFGLKKGGFIKGDGAGGLSGGILGSGKESFMDAARKQGETVPSKAAYISECKKSDKDSQDMCFGMGAFYYRDASFCKYLSDSETKKNCNTETIEAWYTQMANGQGGLPGMTGLTGLTGLAGLGGLTGLPTGDGTGTGSLPGGTTIAHPLNGGDVPEGGVVPDTVVIPPPADGDGTGAGGGGTEEPKAGDLYASAKEIAIPNTTASSLKTVFAGASGAVKFTQYYHNAPVAGVDMYIYTWKNAPVKAQIVSGFESQGYVVEDVGDVLFAHKDGNMYTVDWIDSADDQQIGVMVTDESVTSNSNE